MILSFFEKLGGATEKKTLDFFKASLFLVRCFSNLFLPHNYHPAARMVLTKQIYFTAVQILPLFIVMALLFGSVFIGVIIVLAMEYGLQNEIGRILVAAIFNEFSPFFTAILLALRSGAAINTEMAVMRVNKELDALSHLKISLMSYLIVPRVLNGMFSALALSFLFAILMLLSGYIFTFIFLKMDWATYLRVMLIAFEIQDLWVLTFKSLAFGFVVTVIPIYSGLNTYRSYNAIPISVLNGMVKLFIAIFSIEVVSLLLRLM